VYLDEFGNVSVAAEDFDNGSTDNCNNLSFSIVAGDSTFDCSDVGAPQSITIEVSDGFNVDFCTSTVTVLDTISPTAVCQNITVELNNLGQATIVVSDINNGSFDNCGISSMVLSQTDFDCSHLGANLVTLTITDTSGLTNTCTANVTVEDNIDPIASCQDMTIELDENGVAIIQESDINNSSFDNCGIQSIVLSQTEFDCAHLGDNEVTLTVIDTSGNESTCTANVHVDDVISPVAICQNLEIYLDVFGNASITAGQVNNGSSDNCGIVNYELSETDFTCDDLGDNTVTLTVTDEEGNTDICSATITVLETIAPTALCQDITVQLDENG